MEEDSEEDKEQIDCTMQERIKKLILTDALHHTTSLLLHLSQSLSTMSNLSRCDVVAYSNSALGLARVLY